mgnify:CR=1 FL=1
MTRYAVDRIEEGFALLEVEKDGVCRMEKIRLEQSMTLLTGTHLSIAEIALRVGYSNDKSFRRAFKRHYDKTPTELRQASEKKENSKPE